MNLHKYQAIAYGVSAIANIIIGIFLALLIDEVGMAIGTFISIVFVQSPLMIYVLNNIAGLNVRFFFENIVKSTFISLLLAIGTIWGISELVPAYNWLTFFVGVFLSCVAYSVIIYNFSMDQYERKEVKSIFLRILKKHT